MRRRSIACCIPQKPSWPLDEPPKSRGHRHPLQRRDGCENGLFERSKLFPSHDTSCEAIGGKLGSPINSYKYLWSGEHTRVDSYLQPYTRCDRAIFRVCRAEFSRFIVTRGFQIACLK